MSTPPSFRKVAALSVDLGGGGLVASSVGPDGAACALIAAPVDRERIEGRDVRGSTPPDRPFFPPSTTGDSYAATFVRHDGADDVQRTELADLSIALPKIQPLPGGEVLVVGTRCRRFEDGSAERNAQVFSGDGELLRSFTLGDGINDVQTTSAGDIWVSYFDEGIYGNFGWGREPIGKSALNRFDAAGELKWRNWENDEAGGVPIDECSLNVTDAEVWVCYWSTDFPLARLSNGTVTAWRHEVARAGAIAVSSARALLLVRGRREEASRIAILHLGDGVARVESSWELSAEDAATLREAVVVARGSTLHAFNGADWHRLDLAEL